MNRLLLLLSMVLFSLVTFGQDSAMVKWNYAVEKNGNIYEVALKGIIPDNWYVYDRAKEDGLEGVRSQISDEDLKLNLVEGPNFISISDAVFSKEMKVAKSEVTMKLSLDPGKMQLATVPLILTYDLADGENFIPEEVKLQLILDAEAVANAPQQRILIESIQLDNPVAACEVNTSGTVDSSNSTLLQIFLLGFVGGLVALLTPCVFPMIPLTVSFFTKQSGSRRKGIRSAMLYGFFIFFIYIVLSAPFHFLDQLNPEILNNISTNVYLNVLFFVIFIVFALSFFGLYEITLPANLQNKADSKSSIGNVFGIFFMALTLALVSFSCTGPILGSLLAGSLTTNGGAMQLTAGMAGFGLALALPFALFAMFPQWLNALPKSGGWLTSVKIVLGFLELGLAFKFLSNADLVQHWGILKREIFIGIWVVIGICLTLYLFGILRFKHEYLKKPLPKLRISLGVLSALFTLYLMPGLTNTKYANLSLISGFPPPLYYSIYQNEDNHCIYGLMCTDDYEEGVKMAKETGRAILLDFTGYACVNCRRMEENVWTKPEVLELMKEKFVVISLYVDDKKKLPLDHRFTYITKEGFERNVETVGDKWALFETENFRNNAQPLYAVLDTNEVLMNTPVGYTPDDKAYLEWLKCGLNAQLK